jgi:hypothetical protein
MNPDRLRGSGFFAGAATTVAPAPLRDFADVFKDFEMGNKLTEQEIDFLLRKFRDAYAATVSIPIYEATRYHAINMVVRLEEMVRARKLWK